MSEYLQTSFQFEGKPTFVSLFCFDPKGNCQITYLEVLTRYPLSDPLPDLLDVIVVVFSVVTPSSLESALGKVNKLAPPPSFISVLTSHFPIQWLPAVKAKHPNIPIVLLGAQTKYRDNPKYGMQANPSNFNQGT
mgnify:CR=1 FL=1